MRTPEESCPDSIIRKPGGPGKSISKSIPGMILQPVLIPILFTATVRAGLNLN